MYTDPTIADFKVYFVRDFKFGTDIDKTILDADIQKAIDQAHYSINQALFSDQTFYSICFEWLAAHYLCEDMKASNQGTSGVYEWAVNSKSVGSVSIGLSIPEDMTKSPSYAFLTKTTYGAHYLELIYPYLIGQMFAVHGRTHA